MDQATRRPGDISKQRIEALSDGIYAIALTLLVLDLKVPVLEAGGSNADLVRALWAIAPKALTWFLSFWVMAILWMSQVRIYHHVHSLTRNMVRLELMQVACVSLMPFSTALLGEHGHLPVTSAVYAGNMLAITALGALRTRELLRAPHVHLHPILEPGRRAMKLRAYGLPACAMAAFGLAFIAPGWNLWAMAPMLLLPTLDSTP